MTQQSLDGADPDADTGATETVAPRGVCDESLFVRNYDGDEAHEIQVSFVTHHGDPAFERTLSVAPAETVSVRTRLERAVYRVEVSLESGASDSAECLIGSDPGECAMVETGNGTISVVEAPF